MVMIPHVNEYLPILLGVIVGLVLFDAFDRLMCICNIGINRVPRKGNVEDDEKIEEGIKLIAGEGKLPPPPPSRAHAAW